MEKLYAIEASNSHQSLVFCNNEDWLRLLQNLNRSPLSGNWESRQLNFFSSGKKTAKEPQICVVYVPGLIAFVASKKSEIFPQASRKIELLPVRVNNSDWLLVNCLNSIDDFDREKSVISKSSEGEIFMVHSLRVSAEALGGGELFTLTGSNRMQIFARSSFKSRIEAHSLDGIRFREIGEVWA